MPIDKNEIACYYSGVFKKRLSEERDGVMKKKKRLLLSTAAIGLLLAACGNDLTGDDTSQGTTDPGTESSVVEESITLETSDTLRIAHAQNNRNTLTYNQANPLTMPDGSTISQGDLKPIWQIFSDKLGFQIEDTALQDATADEYMELQSATGFNEAAIYSGAMAEHFMKFGQEGYFVDLSERMDDMPNLQSFLAENPTIEQNLTAPDGGIYYAPYVQEIGYHSMVFFGRPDWPISLLDSEDALETETETIDIAYQGVWEDRNEQNVIDLQNAAATDGTIDRDTARTILLDYIAETYPEYDNPSDLYLGAGAKYDMDELAALWRVIKMSPNTLSKVTTGEVVEGAITTPIFFRTARENHTEYFIRFANYLGGNVIYGADGASTLYLDDNGELQFSLNQPGVLDAFEHTRALFAEGLFYEELANTNSEDNFRTRLYSSDDDPANVQYGFMTLDWIASTSAANPDVEAMLPPMTTWGTDEFVHFVSGSRPLNNVGSEISAPAPEEEINSAIVFLDFMFSEEGIEEMNFGTPDMQAEGEVFTGPDGTEYPKIGDWVFDNAEKFSNSDIMYFYKEFVVVNTETAYPKSIGTELQFTEENGLDAWDLYQNNPILQPSYDATDYRLMITPTVWPISEQQQARLDTTNIGLEQRQQIKLYIYGADSGPQTKEDIAKIYEDANVDTYVNVYREIFESMQ